jgi:hypothetical protein
MHGAERASRRSHLGCLLCEEFKAFIDDGS